jgi:hypothetical protein
MHENRGLLCQFGTERAFKAILSDYLAWERGVSEGCFRLTVFGVIA